MRVAIYAAPGAQAADAPGRALLERAESWLGRSAVGNPVSEWRAPARTGSGRPAVAGEGRADTASAPLPQAAAWSRAEIDAITVDARRYGFHGTLKAPFRLAAGRSLDELAAAVAGFAAERAAVTVPELALTRLGSFFALTPGAPADELYALAADVVTGFDEFRAAPTEADLARRNPAGMTPRRRELFERWGYPYVLDEFRFHLTLTDGIPPEHQDEVEALLSEWFADSIGVELPLDCVTLFMESEPGAPFRLHSVHPLRPEPARTAPTAAPEKESIR